MEQLIVNMTLIIGIIGVLAFTVSVITQVFKGVSGLKKIPTDILVFVLSIGITVVAFIAYMQYIQQTILWYMIIAAIMAGFLVAFVAMYEIVQRADNRPSHKLKEKEILLWQ